MVLFEEPRPTPRDSPLGARFDPPTPGLYGLLAVRGGISAQSCFYAEQWESEEALREHIRSDLYLRLLSAIELSQRPPEVSFYYATETRGFDLVETIRKQLEPKE